MTTATVTTQQELDDALGTDAEIIYINSPAGVWLQLSSSGSATVEAYGSATVRAYDSATVEAYGSAAVRAYDSATVRASDSATVRAYGSATVRASGSATVEAYGSATVRAYGSATVRASDSATVRAYDSATVRASDSATVRASGSATVRASGSATVWASSHVAVHLHSAHATVNGGVVINVVGLDLDDPAVWAAYHGAPTVDDDATVLLYKAVNAQLEAGHDYYRATTYTVGAEITADDWRDNHECGGGLHVSPRPDQAKRYRPSRETGTRFLRVAVKLADLRPIEADKAKARTVRVLAEVDIDGNDLHVSENAKELAR